MITSSPGFRSMPKIKVSIASDALRVIGDFLGVAAKFVGKVAAHRFDPRLEDPPHVLNRRLVGEP